jgi:hypothetical protein
MGEVESQRQGVRMAVAPQRLEAVGLQVLVPASVQVQALVVDQR